jgi:YD repeat-containing protein
MVSPDFYSDGVPTNETPDKDRTTEYTYDPNSRLAIVTAKAQNANDDQKTYYCFWEIGDSHPFLHPPVDSRQGGV